ncbi:maestro heat-like repeat-containing protein family member 2B [Anas acuta]|uniref:maestro heat-like repeat-containing protein family member 2B n=1 Tax=Anas acuta TaxID=28680 RepID=UPI0035C91A6A
MERLRALSGEGQREGGWGLKQDPSQQAAWGCVSCGDFSPSWPRSSSLPSVPIIGAASSTDATCSVLSFLPGVGCWPRRSRRQGRGRVPGPVPEAAPTSASVVTLLERLQDEEGDRAQTYCELESVLWGDDSCLQCGVVNRLLAEVSWDLTADQGVTEDTKVAASDVLVALARSHFSFVLAELLAQLNAPGQISKEFVLITVGKLLSTNALQCIPFMRVVLLGLRTVVGQLGSGRILRAACGALEQCAKVVSVYICTWKGCSLPATEKEQLYENLAQVFCSVTSNWLDCQEEEDKQAVIGAMTPLMRVLLHKEEHREHVWEQLLWLLHQYRTVQDASRVTKSLLSFLEALEQVQIPVPKGKCLAITSVVYSELTDDTKEHSQDQKAELSQCILLQARMCPEETIPFLESQLGHEREAVRVAALGLLGALARCDEPAMAEKLPQVVGAVKSVCRDPSIRVRRAVLHFIRELLSANAQSCSAWDVVGYIFREFSRSSSRRAAGLLSAQEAQEEGALQGLCMDVLGSLDISVRGMAKLLWPRLLIYVMPAKYTGMLIPLSRCLCALAESNELTAGHEHHELDPDVLNALLQDTTLTPHNLLARLLVVAGSPFAGSELQAAALLVLRSLHSRIHAAVGATWNSEIPLLLQYLQGGKGNIPDAAEWERRLLQFLRASLETIGDDAWIKRLSCALSQRLDSSPSSSGEKAFLYKALGTTLAACQELPHVQENLLQHLTRAQPEEPSEAQGIISLVCQAADSHFGLVLETLTTFAATSCSGRGLRVSRRRKTPQASRRAEATCSAVMLAHSSMALRASKEQLLAHVEADIAGNILLLSISSSQNLQTNLAMAQSILEVGCAVQAVGNLGSFHPVLKQKLLLILQVSAQSQGCLAGEFGAMPGGRKVSLSRMGAPEVRELSCAQCPLGNFLLQNLVKTTLWDFPAASLHLKVILALEQWSKLETSFSSEEIFSLLSDCCQAILPLPSAAEQIGKIRNAEQAVLQLQSLHMATKALGRLMAVLLKTKPSPVDFVDIAGVLWFWLSSDKPWVCKKALQVCAQLLEDCRDGVAFQTRGAYLPFGALAGLLGPLTCEPTSSSRQLAAACLSSLLHIQAKATNRLLETDDPASLCEGLSARSDASQQLRTSIRIAEMVCKNVPKEQAEDFMNAIQEPFRRARGSRVCAAGHWMVTFLETRGKDIGPDVRDLFPCLGLSRFGCRTTHLAGCVLKKLSGQSQGSGRVRGILSTLHSCTESMLEPLLMFFVHHAVLILARHHERLTVNIILEKFVPLDRNTLELWRTLGRASIGLSVLKRLARKLRRVGDDSCQPSSSSGRLHAQQPSAESLTVTHAISEMVSVQFKEGVQSLLPSLLPGLLLQLSKALGEEMLFAPLSPWRGHAEDQRQEGNVCRPFCETLMSVLSKCAEKNWLTPFWRQKMLALLESPRTYAEGMCLLTSVLLRAQLISRELIEIFSQWLRYPSANLQLTAMAFFAELMKEPPLEKRNVLKTLRVLAEKAQHRSSTIRQLAARALGNAAGSMPVEVRKCRRRVVRVLQRSLADTACPEVAAESMLALAELVRVLQVVTLGSAFEDIARSTKMFFESEEEYLRYSALRLYSVLASSASSKGLFFAREVAETWVSLFLHLRDPDFAVASGSLSSEHLRPLGPFAGHAPSCLPLPPGAGAPLGVGSGEQAHGFGRQASGLGRVPA